MTSLRSSLRETSNVLKDSDDVSHSTPKYIPVGRRLIGRTLPGRNTSAPTPVSEIGRTQSTQDKIAALREMHEKMPEELICPPCCYPPSIPALLRIKPSLVELPKLSLESIHRELREEGKRMYSMLPKLSVPQIPLDDFEGLEKLEIPRGTIRPNPIFPTHALAILVNDVTPHAKQQPVGEEWVRFYPIHWIYFAAFCPNVGMSELRSYYDAKTLFLPFMKYLIADTSTFPMLIKYFYTQDPSDVAFGLLPGLRYMHVSSIQEKSKILAQSSTASDLGVLRDRVEMFVENLRFLGISHGPLWEVLNHVWSIIYGAMPILVGILEDRLQSSRRRDENLVSS